MRSQLVVAATDADDVAKFQEVVAHLSDKEQAFAAHLIVLGNRHALMNWWSEQGFPVGTVMYGESLLSTAAGAGNEPMVRRLLQLGASLSGVPLVAAAYAGSLECVKLLVEAGADVNVGHKGFPTPLSTAIAFKHHEIEAYLRAHGATKLVGEGAPE